MNLHITHYNDLTRDELFAIYQIRTAIFVVEQNCPYQEVDNADRYSYHVWLEEDGVIKAYCRIIEAGINFKEVSIGRVLATERRHGYATEIVRTGIQVAEERYHADAIRIEAQVYAKKLYENLGFVCDGDEFLEDGIPHIAMVYHKTSPKRENV